MQVHRCPECGGRLKTNYCDICLRKVPFKGTPAKQTWQQEAGSSAHWAERHKCITFDAPKKTLETIRQTIGSERKQAETSNKAKKVKISAIILAALSVISSLFGFVEDLLEDEPVPEYNQEAYIVEADVPDITPTELYNDGGIVIAADSAGLYYDDYAIAMTIDNGSEQDIDVSTAQLSVNGYMFSFGMSAQVEAGDSAQVFLPLYSYDLEEVGITQIASVQFYLHIYDAEEYTEIAATELITLKTDIADDAVEPIPVSGMELYNDGSVMILLTGAEISSYGDGSLDLYISNVSGSMVSVSAPTIRLNGQEVSGNLWSTLRPGTRAVTDVYIYDLEDLEITGFEQIEEISLDLHIEYMEDWYVSETINETVTFSPNDLRY